MCFAKDRELTTPVCVQLVDVIMRLAGVVRVLVTSREEDGIKRALEKFKPQELRADEAKNRMDVAMYLRAMAKQFVDDNITAADLAVAVKKEFKQLVIAPGRLLCWRSPSERQSWCMARRERT